MKSLFDNHWNRIQEVKFEDDLSMLQNGEKLVKILIPTHRFIEGRPISQLTRDHAFQMWDDVKKRVSNGPRF